MGGYRDNGDVCHRPLLLGTNRLRGFYTIHMGHLDIHQDQIKGLPPHSGQSLSTILHGGYGMATLFEQAHGQALIHEIVFGKQYV